MALTTVGAVAQAVTALAGLAQPVLDQSVTEKYDNALESRNQQIARIAGMPTSDDDEEAARADAFHRLIDQLCVDAGYPAAGLSDDVSIPIPYLVSLLSIAAQKIHTDGELTELMSALEKAKS